MSSPRTRSVSPLSAALDSAPDASGVYFSLGADAELLYAGKAANLRKRLRQHAHFFLHGPRALRRLRTHHGRSAGLMSRAVIKALVVDDLRAAIGHFQVPRPPDAADEILGRRAHRWVKQ